MGETSNPDRQSFSRSRRNPRWTPRSPVKRNVAQRTLGTSAGAASGGASYATVSTTSRSSPSTRTLDRPSRVRHSMLMSFRKMARAPRIGLPSTRHDGTIGGRDGVRRPAVEHRGDAAAVENGGPRGDRRGAVGLVEERAGECQPLAHATRVEPYRAPPGRLEARPRQQRTDPLARRRDVEEAGVEGEILGAAEIRVAEALVREVSQPTPQLRRRAPRVDAEEREPALARAEEEREDAQQGRLACP